MQPITYINGFWELPGRSQVPDGSGTDPGNFSGVSRDTPGRVGENPGTRPGRAGLVGPLCTLYLACRAVKSRCWPAVAVTANYIRLYPIIPDYWPSRPFLVCLFSGFCTFAWDMSGSEKPLRP